MKLIRGNDGKVLGAQSEAGVVNRSLCKSYKHFTRLVGELALISLPVEKESSFAKALIMLDDIRLEELKRPL